MNQPLNANHDTNTHFYEGRKPLTISKVQCFSLYPKGSSEDGFLLPLGIEIYK